MSKKIAIAGGGLAGLTCAKYLADAGFSVQLFEKLPYLGGRASTFRDSDGDWVEQGLHLFLGSYSEFRKLLDDTGIGTKNVIFWMSEIRFQDTLGPSAVYGINPLQSPLKTFLSVLGQNQFLGAVDKLSLLPVTADGFKSIEALRREFDNQTVWDWWKDIDCTTDIMERLLRPFCRAIQFTDAEEFSAFNFLGWLHHVFYNLNQSLAGGYRGARDEIIFQPLARYLEKRGVSIRTGIKLQKISYSAAKNQVTAFVLDSGERIEADTYVVALPPWQFHSLIPPGLQKDPFFSNIGDLTTAPAIAVQLWFDRQIISTADFNLVAHSEIPVYQEQSPHTYPNPEGSRLSATISPADNFLDRPDAELVRLTIERLVKVQPEMRNARLMKSIVIKHDRHIVRPLPGAMSARPGQKTPVPNFFLAGDWTQQDFFGSQEGAVRGGKKCAVEMSRSFKSNK